MQTAGNGYQLDTAAVLQRCDRNWVAGGAYPEGAAIARVTTDQAIINTMSGFVLITNRSSYEGTVAAPFGSKKKTLRDCGRSIALLQLSASS